MEKENSRLFVPKAYLTTGFRRIYHLVLSFTKQDVWFSNTAENSLVVIYKTFLTVWKHLSPAPSLYILPTYADILSLC